MRDPNSIRAIVAVYLGALILAALILAAMGSRGLGPWHASGTTSRRSRRQRGTSSPRAGETSGGTDANRTLGSRVGPTRVPRDES